MADPIIIAMICKNESAYIEEFVEYHLNLGFDKIIIGDNNDIDGERYEGLLNEYINNDRVRIINLRGLQAQQKVFYNSIKNHIKYEWCAFIDTDEFITFANGSGFNNIKDFLHSRPEIKAYKLNWKLYGDNEQIVKKEGKVTERFKSPLDKRFRFRYAFPENYHTKSILHWDCNVHFTNNPHTVLDLTYYTPMGVMKDGSPFNPDMEYGCCYIRHYYTKSLEEWINNKLGRSYADYLRSNDIDYYPLSTFFAYNRWSPSKQKYIEEHGLTYSK